jgi:hypothetical protein
MFGEIAPKMRGAGSQFSGAVPAGSAIEWWQPDSSVAVPPGWAICNGQTYVWETGPRAGQSFVSPNFIGMLSQGGDLLSQTNTANASGFGNQSPQTAVGSTLMATSANNSYTYASSYRPIVFAAANGHYHEGSIEPASIATTRLIKL